MSSDNKGVEPSIEEILASIRRIIVDSASPTPNTLATSHAPPPLNSPQRIDDDEAFELPAMFRSPHSLAHPLPPQIGDTNLDGHRIDWQQRPENRGREGREASFEQPPTDLEQGVRAQEFDTGAELPATSWALVPDTAESEPSVSVSGVAPAMSTTTPPPLLFSQPSIAADVPRQMVACKDTLVVGGMGQSRAETRSGVWTSDVPRPRIPADGLSYGPIIPADFRVPGTQPSAAKTGGPTEPKGEAGPNNFTPITEGFIDQTAAALLRPLLKQWLDSNMRSVFERALHVEVESAKDRQQ
jgi:hypothetical protein